MRETPGYFYQAHRLSTGHREGSGAHPSALDPTNPIADDNLVAEVQPTWHRGGRLWVRHERPHDVERCDSVRHPVHEQLDLVLPSAQLEFVRNSAKGNTAWTSEMSARPRSWVRPPKHRYPYLVRV